MPNVRLALRTLFKTPFVTVVAILSLSLGIGANAAIFSLFNQMLLQGDQRPIPVDHHLLLARLDWCSRSASAGWPNPCCSR